MIKIGDREHKVIDAHAHFWNHFNGTRLGGIKLEPLGWGMVREADKEYRFLAPEYADNQVPAEIFLAYMNETGIDKGVILQNPCYGDQSDYIKEVMDKNPGRFVALGLIDPRDKEGVVKRMDVYVKQYGFKGFKIEVPDVPFILDAEEYDFLWKKVVDLGVICAFDLGWRDGPFDYNIDRLENVMRRYPTMRTVLCHLGISRLWDVKQAYPFPYLQRTLSLLDINKDNLYFDFSGLIDTETGFGYPEYPYVRTLSFLKATKEAWGVDRLMWGSDAPMIMRYCTYPQTLYCFTKHCDWLSPAEFEKILYSNAQHFYFNDK